MSTRRLQMVCAVVSHDIFRPIYCRLEWWNFLISYQRLSISSNWRKKVWLKVLWKHQECNWKTVMKASTYLAARRYFASWMTEWIPLNSFSDVSVSKWSFRAVIHRKINSRKIGNKSVKRNQIGFLFKSLSEFKRSAPYPSAFAFSEFESWSQKTGITTAGTPWKTVSYIDSKPPWVMKARSFLCPRTSCWGSQREIFTFGGKSFWMVVDSYFHSTR